MPKKEKPNPKIIEAWAKRYGLQTASAAHHDQFAFCLKVIYPAFTELVVPHGIRIGHFTRVQQEGYMSFQCYLYKKDIWAFNNCNPEFLR